MPLWSSYHKNIQGWTTVKHALAQHVQLLETGGFPCKILIRNLGGESIIPPEDPIVIAAWDSVGSTTTSPYKKIWVNGNDDYLYPDPDTIRVWVDGEELTRTYNEETITQNTEYYIVVTRDSVDVDDNVAIYLNVNFSVSGKEIAYSYNNKSKTVSVYNQQPEPNALQYRSAYGFTQYLNTTSKFRGVATPHTIPISFPPPPAFDTNFSLLGRTEEWQNRGWTLGTLSGFPQLHEFDLVYRVADQRWYEVKDWEPNMMEYKGKWEILTQSFTLTQLAEKDAMRGFQLS